MGVSYGTGSVRISGGTVDATIENSGIAINYLANKVAASTVSLGVVPVGKVWRIYNIFLSYGTNATTGYDSPAARLYIDSTANTLFYIPNANTTANADTMQVSLGNQYIELTAGQDLILLASANCYASAFISYKEVTA